MTNTPTTVTPGRFVDQGDGTIRDTQTTLVWEKKGADGGLHTNDHSWVWAGACSGNPSTYCQPTTAARAQCEAVAGVGGFGCATCGPGEGTCGAVGTVWTWLAQVNNTCADGTTDCTSGGDAACAGIGDGRCGFAGHRDWRIPKMNQAGSPAAAELETIVDTSASGCGSGAACTFDLFRSPCTPGCSALSCACTRPETYWSATTHTANPHEVWDVFFVSGNQYADEKHSPAYVRAVRSGACGNGGLDAGEQCDDGNTIGGDGCSAACQVESGWTCGGQPSVCTAGNGQACGSGAHCTSGFCVDGVCCTSACGGGSATDCQACSVAAGATADGTCSLLSGRSCNDGNPNTVNDVCTAGVCAGVTPTPTNTPTATPTVTPTATPTATLAAGCPAAPVATCASAGKNSVLVQVPSDATKRKLLWKWLKGTPALTQGDFGDPVNSTSYRLCVYDESGTSPVFKMGATVTSGGTCGTKPCWKAVSDKGWSYKNATGNGSGITKLQLKGGLAGKPQVQVQGKGSSLPLPTPISTTKVFNQDPAVIVQLQRTDPTPGCWSSTFDTTSTKKNDGVQFKAVTK